MWFEGTVFVIATIVMGLRLRRPVKPGRPRRRPSGGPWEMPLIGATNTLLGFSGIATMYLAARVMQAVGEDVAVRVLAYAEFVIAMLAPYVILAWAWRRFPSVSSRVTRLFSRLAEVDIRPWSTGLTLTVGVILLAVGIWGEPNL